MISKMIFGGEFVETMVGCRESDEEGRKLTLELAQ